MNAALLVSLIVIILGGVAIAVQAPINARLSAELSDPILAAAISTFLAFLAVAVLVLVRGAVPNGIGWGAIPWWAWLGGFAGAFYVWAAIWTVPVLGVVTMIAALVLGQLVTALILDASGAFGLPVREVKDFRLMPEASFSGM